MTTEETKRDRSPAHPKTPLAQAIGMVEALYSKVGRSRVQPQVAVGPLGYSGLNGAALGAIGTLTQYGLLDREGGLIRVSGLAIRLIHPVDPSAGAKDRKESALLPRVFTDLYSSGFHHSSEDVVRNHLIQQGFTPDAARRAASVFIENIDFAKLSDDSITVLEDVTDKTPQQTQKPTVDAARSAPTRVGNELARYSIHIGANEAMLVITGQELTAEDFDALSEFIEFSKKQFQRQAKLKPLQGLDIEALTKV